MKLNLSTKIIVAFSLIILCSLISFWMNIKLSSEVTRNTEYVTNSEMIIRNSAKIHRIVLTMQNSIRGYLLTNDSTFLQAYYEGQTELPLLFKEEKSILQDSPEQLLKLDSIDAMQKEWITYSDAIVIAKSNMIKHSETTEYAQVFEERLKSLFGKRMMTKITAKFKEFDKHEYLIRKERRENLTASIYTARQVTTIMAIITISIGIICAVYITHQISSRIRSMVILAESISKGKFEVIEDKKNDELTELSKSLNIMSEKLKQSFLELDQFAYVVSHDLKAPLRGMYNIVQWIEEDFGTEIPEKMTGYMEKLRGRIHRMENLITGLLEYSRIGRTQQTKEKVYVEKMIEEITDTVVPKEFTVTMKTSMPTLMTEKIRLHQVFSNLLSNAVKYKSTKPAMISIACKDIGDRYRFTVSDNGVGIAKEYHQKIFGIFQTLREKHEAESTGIGLSIVKKIIEDKKGTIFVTSEIGAGTKFIFTWPKYEHTT